MLATERTTTSILNKFEPNLDLLKKEYSNLASELYFMYYEDLTDLETQAKYDSLLDSFVAVEQVVENVSVKFGAKHIRLLPNYNRTLRAAELAKKRYPRVIL